MATLLGSSVTRYLCVPRVSGARRGNGRGVRSRSRPFGQAAAAAPRAVQLVPDKFRWGGNCLAAAPRSVNSRSRPEDAYPRHGQLPGAETPFVMKTAQYMPALPLGLLRDIAFTIPGRA